MEHSMNAARVRKTVGAVAAAGVALGGLAVIAPDADAQAYGQTCNLVLNTDAPADPHWDAMVEAQMSSSNVFEIPVYLPPGATPNGATVSAPYIPMSTASMPAAAAAGSVICVIGNHPAIINGGANNDTIYGGAGNETINGGGGNDEIWGGGGNDVLIGKAGNDSLNGGAGDDILFGHAGQNTATTAPPAAGADDHGNDTLNGGDGNDLLRGDYGNDLLNGHNGDDCLLGGKGNDEAYGWNGNDTVGGGAGADYLAGNDNNDMIFGGKGNDTLRGNDGLDQVWGDSDLFDEGHEMTLGAVGVDLEIMTTVMSMMSTTGAGPRIGRLQPHVRFWTGAATFLTTMAYTSMFSTMFVPVMTWDTVGISGAPVPAPVVGVSHLVTGFLDLMTYVLTAPASMVLTTAMTTLNFHTVSAAPGSALSSSGPIMGPVVVRGNKVDYQNSSAVGGIEVSIATITQQHWVNGIKEWFPISQHATSSGKIVDDDFVSMPNHFTMTIPGGIFTNLPHMRKAHLEVAACNLDAPRIMDDAFTVPQLAITAPWTAPGPPVFVTLPAGAALVEAFSGQQIIGLGTIHMSMIAMSSVGDVEIPLLETITVAPATKPQYGPSGAFLQWPGGWNISTGYNDDIRGGDSDDRLFGEAGHDTIWGDHGDDTIKGEGDAAAWELNDAAFNVRARPMSAPNSIAGVPLVGWSPYKSKLPIGVEAQYTGAGGDDSLSGNLDDDNMMGGVGNDTVHGGPDDDHLMGGAGLDRLHGGGHWDGCSPQGGFVADCEVLI